MLRNELQEIENLLFAIRLSDSNAIAEMDISVLCSRIRRGWEEAAFSGRPDYSLVRYFHYQLKGISKISDTLFRLPGEQDTGGAQGELLALIDHMEIYYAPYFDADARLPAAYHQKFACGLSANVKMISGRLQTSKLSNSLKTCLFNWLDELSAIGCHERYAFRSLTYFEKMINGLLGIDLRETGAEDQLISLLSRSNFNHLAFFAYRQDMMRGIFEGLIPAEKLRYLRLQKAAVLSCPVANHLIYDAGWPSLKTMVDDWLREEIGLAELELRNEDEAGVGGHLPKLHVELSVAHLACLIRLFVEESVFGKQNLKIIFKCFAGYYQTKRQPIISPGSLSKEYYSIDQHTAARMRDLLQKMVQRINRNFFPVMAVISITILSHPGTH